MSIFTPRCCVCGSKSRLAKYGRNWQCATCWKDGAQISNPSWSGVLLVAATVVLLLVAGVTWYSMSGERGCSEIVAEVERAPSYQPVGPTIRKRYDECRGRP